MGKWLKELREANNMTQRTLAEKTAVSEQYIYFIESGDRRPSVDTAKRIAEVLGFPWTRFYEDGEK